MRTVDNNTRLADLSDEEIVPLGRAATFAIANRIRYYATTKMLTDETLVPLREYALTMFGNESVNALIGSCDDVFFELAVRQLAAIEARTF
jgi:hypothetical protein